MRFRCVAALKTYFYLLVALKLSFHLVAAMGEGV